MEVRKNLSIHFNYLIKTIDEGRVPSTVHIKNRAILLIILMRFNSVSIDFFSLFSMPTKLAARLGLINIILDCNF